MFLYTQINNFYKLKFFKKYNKKLSKINLTICSLSKLQF